MSLKQYLNFINGEFTAPRSGRFINVINPVTEAVISEVPDSSAEDVDLAVEAAFNAKKQWGRLPSHVRAGHLNKLAAIVREYNDLLARTATEEQGKIVGESRWESGRCADYIEFAAQWARRLEGEVVPTDGAGETLMILKQPRGVVAGILPWNAPVMSIGRKLGPALIAGNTIVIKPSSLTPNNAFEFAKLVQHSDFPKGVINVISGRGSAMGRLLVQHPKVNFVSMTGSVEAGQDIVRNSALNLTRVSLELGGKAPAIVMADADLDVAITSIMKSRFFGFAGAVCVAAERLYIHEDIADEFLSRLVAEVKKVKIGDPMQPETNMGPVVSRETLDTISGLVDRAVQAGAKVVVGGKRPSGFSKGFYYEPTILTDCRPDMEIMRQEIFGPVFVFSTFKTIEEAIELANDCEYGLASSIFTRNMGHILKAANELEFGETAVNRMNGSIMQGYHAGWKKSGLGGDDGKHGIAEYLQTHVVHIQYE